MKIGLCLASFPLFGGTSVRRWCIVREIQSHRPHLAAAFSFFPLVSSAKSFIFAMQHLEVTVLQINIIALYGLKRTFNKRDVIGKRNR